MKNKIISFFIICMIVCSFSGCNTVNTKIGNTTVSGELEISFIDVGQGDCIFIKMPQKKTMLIDAGESSETNKVQTFLKSKNVSKIDVIVGTHPHSDHIGGLENIISNYDVEKIYMPKVSATTKTFEKLLLAIKREGIKITDAKAGVKISLDDNVSMEFVSPNKDSYDDTNNYSAVLLVKYINNSFILMGDAEDVAEKEILNAYADINADLIKIGHHGSSSSTTSKFLDKISPKYAVISVGKDNPYNHPSKEVIERLNKTEVFRTDLSGNITALSDGSKIKISTDKMRAK